MPLSEFDFIARLRSRTQHGAHQPADLAIGIGDDAAVIKNRSAYDSVITADLLVEDIDFRRAWTTPRLLGHKALAVSLSDIAAMGARPRWALITLGVPQAMWSSRFVDGFYEGLLALADMHEVKIIGGDVSRTPDRLVVDSIVLGDVPRGQAVLRSGAQVGDAIFVTGALGGAAAGLQLLERGVNFPKSRGARREILQRHLRPLPQVEWGLRIGEKRLASAMIDVSDGLSSDLAHLCRESRVGASIEAARVPIDPLIAKTNEANPNELALALHGGEDYELLFTVPSRNLANLPKHLSSIPVTHIGNVTDQAAGLRIIEDGRWRTLTPGGFIHFSARP